MFVLQERTSHADDAKQKLQFVKPKIEVPGMLQLSGQNMKSAIPSSEIVFWDGWHKYYQINGAKK